MGEPAPEMTQSLFEVLAGGVNLDPQTTLAVQSLLESQNVAETAQVEEDDIFVCGKCKKQFTSLPLFVNHKQTRCTSTLQRQYHANSSFSASHTPTLSSKQDNIYSVSSSSPVPSISQNIVLNDDLITTFTGLDANSIQVGTIQNNPFLSPLSPVSHSSSGNGLSTFTISTSSFSHQPFNVQASCSSVPATGAMVTVHDTPQPINKQNTIKISDYQVNDPSRQNMGVIAVIPDNLTQESAILKPLRARAVKGILQEEKKTLKCQYCSKIFTKNFDLQQHIRSHTGEKPFQCIVCGRAFAQKSNVKKHMQTHKVWPNGSSSTLPRQPVVVRSQSDADVNSGNSDGSVHQTEDFTMGVEAKTDEDGNVNIYIDNAYLCQYCPKRFKTYTNLKSHMVQHKSEQVYRCVLKICGATFHDLDAFLDHTKSHESEMSYRCHMCSKKFPSLYELGVHQYSHSLYPNQGPKPGIRYYKCSKCGNKYSSTEALEEHLETSSHHFPCSHCDKVFTCERYLRRHLTTHGAKKHGCHQCGKTFHNEYYLKSHLLIHSGEKPFKCEKCEATFNRSDKLKRHLTIHEPVKKYKCPFRSHTGCQKAFNRPDKLKAHIISHSGIKPFKCKECGKAFSRRPHLREHERAHKKDFRFKCNDCSKGFFRLKLFQNHKCKMASMVKMEESLSTSSRLTTRRRAGRPRKVVEVLAEDATKAGEAVVVNTPSPQAEDGLELLKPDANESGDSTIHTTDDANRPAKKRGFPRQLGLVVGDDTRIDDELSDHKPEFSRAETETENVVIDTCSGSSIEQTIVAQVQAQTGIAHLQLPQAALEQIHKSVEAYSENGGIQTIHITTVDGTTQICVSTKSPDDVDHNDQQLAVHQMNSQPVTLMPITALQHEQAYGGHGAQVYAVGDEFASDVDQILHGQQNPFHTSADLMLKSNNSVVHNQT